MADVMFPSSAAASRRLRGISAHAREHPVGGMRWVVVTSAEVRGGNVRIVIDAKDGEIVLAGYAPR
jgi:hypothetical protein